MRHEAVGRVRDERHQRVLHRRHVALHQLLRRLACRVVQRREHDIEALEDPVGEVEPAVGQDVDLAAVQDRDLRIPLRGARRSRRPACSRRSASGSAIAAELCE